MIKNEKGFSLIELMVVVAIIGILSAVAVPQFQKFQRKAKQSEAKAMLSAIYTAQKAFLAETGSYYSNLRVLGVTPSGSLKYTAGFSSPLGSNLPGYSAAGYQHQQYASTFWLCRNAWADGIVDECMFEAGVQVTLSTVAGAAWVVTSNTFVAGAHSRAGSLGIGGTVVDQWTMNQRKELINVSNGAL